MPSTNLRNNELEFTPTFGNQQFQNLYPNLATEFYLFFQTH